MKKLFMFLIVLVLGLPVFTLAEMPEENPLLPNALLLGTVESTGTHFEVTNSEYLNVVLDSFEKITLRLESVPEMVTMHIESASEATSSQITISGFKPLTTYYKYEDDYHNEVVFTTDENGSYAWTQDLIQPHLVFIQPRKSTKFIADDATGGDCYLIGTWNSATKTCTLTTDINETIQIDSNYITLDGNGRTVTGTGTGSGVYLYGRTGVAVKNLNVEKFSSGIFLWYSSNNTLTGNTASNNSYYGIYLYYSSNNNLTGNTASNNSWGIYLQSSSNNNLIDNISQENYYFDLYVNAASDSQCNNVIQNTRGSGDRPIKYFNSSVNLENETLSELILCNADHSSINNVTIDGSETLKNNGLVVFRTDYSNITNTNSSNNYYGIHLYYSSNNNISGNTASNNSGGIILDFSSSNTVTGNTAEYNYSWGITTSYSTDNTVTDNTASNNSNGLIFVNARNNTVTDNIVSGSTGYGGYGILLDRDSSNNSFTGNIALNNTFGLVIFRGCYNNAFVANTACNNTNYDFFVESPVTESDNICDNVCLYLYPIKCIPCSAAGIDTVPPTVTVSASPSILWPPNYKMVDVLINGSAIDEKSGIASIVITVTDEYGIYNMTVPGFGSIVQLEAWREGTDKDGRHYTITVVATDKAGNQSTATTQVIVPHDMGK